MIAKYYERIGDHATNIAEWVEFFHSWQAPKQQRGIDKGLVKFTKNVTKLTVFVDICEKNCYNS